MTKRERLYPEIKRLREDEALTWREIGERLGISLQTAHQYYTDPTGEEVRARKMKKARLCLGGCGTLVNTDGRTTNPNLRCTRCLAKHRRAESRKWIVESMQEWCLRFGAPPSSTDWNPAYARASVYCAWKAERYEQTGVRWPCASLVSDCFGSWNAGLIAAGFRPLAPSEYWIGHAGVALREADRAAA